MATNVQNNVAYSITQPLSLIFSDPHPSRRDPTIRDRAPIGFVWSNTLTNTIFMLASITNGQSNWVTIGGNGGGLFTSLTVNPGNITATAGNFVLTNPDALIVMGAGPTISAGTLANIPAGAVPAGSLYIVTNGANSSSVLYVNNDGVAGNFVPLITA